MKIKIISISITLIIILSTFAGCRKVNSDMSSGSTSDITSTVYDIVDVIENENSEMESTDDTTSDETQSTESDNNSTVTSDENIFTDNVVSVGDGDNKADPDAPLTFIDSETTGSTVTDTSKGYDKITCTTSPDSKTGNVVTVLIAANGSVTYKIDRVVNKILTINSSSAYVVYNGTKYEAKNGVVSFVVAASDKLSSDQIVFEIGNNSSKPESFTVNFASPKGSRENPEVVDSIDNNFTTSIAEGNQQGYYYSYIATKAGKIRFYILSDSKSGMLTIDKIINPKLGVVQQRNTTEDEDYVKTDKTGTYVEFDVKDGDKFSISVSPNASSGKYPAITVEWKILYN